MSQTTVEPGPGVFPPTAVAVDSFRQEDVDEAGSLSAMFHYCPSHSEGVAIYQSRPALQYVHFLSPSLLVSPSKGSLLQGHSTIPWGKDMDVSPGHSPTC